MKMLRLSAALILAALMPSLDAPSPIMMTEAQAAPPRASEASAAAALISRYRASYGLGPVRVDSKLNAAASHQARAVAQTGWLSHGDFAGRMAAFGIRGKAAENLSAGIGSVEGVIAQWQGSSGHNTNMLMPEFSRIGIARVDSGRPYWALVLAR
jgi:uncharacterized protein YkwD